MQRCLECMHEERSAAMAALRYLLFPDQSQASLPQKWKPFHHSNQRGNKKKDTTISDLLAALNIAGFHYYTRVKELIDDLNIVIERKLV